MKIENLKTKLYKFLLLIMGLVFLYLTIRIIFNNNSYFGKINVYFSILGIFIYNLFLFLFYILIVKKSKLLDKKKERLILIMFFTFYIFIQIIIGINLEVTPTWDFGAVYNSAVSFAKNNSFYGLDYYSTFPNNLMLLIIQSLIFKISFLVGIKNFCFVGMLLNVISINLSILLIYKFIKNKFNIKWAFFSIIVSSTILAFITYIPIFYSDTTSLPYVIGLIYMLECVKVENFKHKYLYYLIISLICFIGYMIKMTTIICFIGIIIYHVLSDKKFFVESAKKISIMVVIIFLLNFLFSYFIINNMNKITKIEQVPYTHWIMMGMNKETMGTYSAEDYTLITFSATTSKEREKINIKEIKKRLKNFGFIGYLKFISDKSTMTWGDGTYFSPEKLRREPVNNTIIHKYVLANGENFKTFYFISQIVHFSIMIVMTISMFILMFKKEKNFYFAICLSIFGIFIFLSIWETRSRYLINFIPLFIILSIYGYEKIFNKIANKLNINDKIKI